MLRQNSKPINNAFMNSGDSFPSFKGVHAVLDSPGDKIHLQAFLETDFENIAATGIEIIYCVVGNRAEETHNW